MTNPKDDLRALAIKMKDRGIDTLGLAEGAILSVMDNRIQYTTTKGVVLVDMAIHQEKK